MDHVGDLGTRCVLMLKIRRVNRRRALEDWEIQSLDDELETFWSLLSSAPRTGTRDDLELLQRWIDDDGLALDEPITRRALGLALGMVLVHELDLEWHHLLDATADPEGDLSVGVPDEETLYARPLQMISACLDEGTPLRLTEVFETAVLRFSGVSRATLPPRCTSEFEVQAPELQARLTELATTLQRDADLSFLAIRGTSFLVTVDAGRGSVRDLTMKMSFAGPRAMLAVAGGRAGELEQAGDALLAHAKACLEIERVIDEYLAKHPAQATALAPLGE